MNIKEISRFKFGELSNLINRNCRERERNKNVCVWGGGGVSDTRADWQILNYAQF